jgi:hypothetical protein
VNPRGPIYRAPMHARDRDLPAGAGADFGVEQGVVGIGDGAGPRFERMLARFAGLADGTFVWTRGSDGRYRLGRITGPLRRERSAAAEEVGVVHVRPATWLARPFGDDEVPVAVAATFARGGRNLQRTRDDGAERRTAELWEQHGG